MNSKKIEGISIWSNKIKVMNWHLGWDQPSEIQIGIKRHLK